MPPLGYIVLKKKKRKDRHSSQGILYFIKLMKNR